MYAAALAVYAERGWYGFSLEAVGRQAGVGQGAMYRRWSSKAALLAEAIEAHAPVFPSVDTGSTREDLVALARHFVLNYRAAIGIVGLRMVLDTRTNPELAEHFDQMLKGSRAVAARDVVARGLARGDLRQAPAGLILEIISGATLSHVLYTPHQADLAAGTTTPADERLVKRLIDSLLAD